jgi:hypothetical protein
MEINQSLSFFRSTCFISVDYLTKYFIYFTCLQNFTMSWDQSYTPDVSQPVRLRNTVLDKAVELSPWEVIATHTVRKFIPFYGNRRHIVYLQKPATGPYPEPDESSRHETWGLRIVEISCEHHIILLFLYFMLKIHKNYSNLHFLSTTNLNV